MQLSRNPSLLRTGAVDFAVSQVGRLSAVPIMPLKGAMILATARRGEARPVSDLDVLVEEHDYEKATRSLERRGFRVVGVDRDDRARTLSGPVPMPVDLHRRLFSNHLFRMCTEEVFARGEHSTYYDAPVVLPHPLDAFAHILGHLAKSRRSVSRDEGLRDLEALAQYHALDPHSTARHLEHCGLGRAARYVLPQLVDDGLRPAAREYAGATLSALCCDPHGDRLAAFARRSIPSNSVRELLALHALNRSFGWGAVSLASHAAHGALSRSRRPSPGRR